MSSKFGPRIRSLPDEGLLCVIVTHYFHAGGTWTIWFTWSSMHAFSILDRAIEFTKFKLYTRDQFHVRASLASWEITLAILCPCIFFFFLFPLFFFLAPLRSPPQSARVRSAYNTAGHFAFVSDRTITIRYLNVSSLLRAIQRYVTVLAVDTEQLAMGSPSRSR